MYTCFIIKIIKKEKLQQIVLNHSTYIDYKNLINLNKKRFAKLYSFLVIDNTFASDIAFSFRKNLLERI